MRSLAGAKPMSWGHSGSTLKDLLSFRMAEGHFALLILFQCGCLSKVTSARIIQNSQVILLPPLPFFPITEKLSLRDYPFLFLTLPGSCTEHISAETKGLAITREANCWRPPDRPSPAACLFFYPISPLPSPQLPCFPWHAPSWALNLVLLVLARRSLGLGQLVMYSHHLQYWW